MLSFLGLGSGKKEEKNNDVELRGSDDEWDNISEDESESAKRFTPAIPGTISVKLVKTKQQETPPAIAPQPESIKKQEVVEQKQLEKPSEKPVTEIASAPVNQDMKAEENPPLAQPEVLQKQEAVEQKEEAPVAPIQLGKPPEEPIPAINSAPAEQAPVQAEGEAEETNEEEEQVADVVEEKKAEIHEPDPQPPLIKKQEEKPILSEAQRIAQALLAEKDKRAQIKKTIKAAEHLKAQLEQPSSSYNVLMALGKLKKLNRTVEGAKTSDEICKIYTTISSHLRLNQKEHKPTKEEKLVPQIVINIIQRLQFLNSKKPVSANANVRPEGESSVRKQQF